MVAALCYAIASRSARVNADEVDARRVCSTTSARSTSSRARIVTTVSSGIRSRSAQVMRDWHSNVGKAIVENWGFPEHIAEAIAEHENIDRSAGYADVTDVLTVAVMMAGFMGHEVDLELNMQGVKAFWRLELDNRSASTSCVTRRTKSRRCARRSATDPSILTGTLLGC